MDRQTPGPLRFTPQKDAPPPNFPASLGLHLCVAPGSDSRATDCSLYSGENRRLVCFVISSLQVGIQFTAWSGIREQRQSRRSRCRSPARASDGTSSSPAYHYLGYKNPGRRPDALRRPRPRRPAARHARLQHGGTQARAPRPLHRMDAATAREEPPPRDRQSAVPHLALDHDPQPGLAHPLAGPPATARRLDRALQHHARAHRDLRRDPALHRRLVQGVRLDSRRNHQGTGPIRPTHQTGSTEEGHLAAAAA